MEALIHVRAFVEELWKPRKALDAFTLRVEPGTVYGLVGPNGSGKTWG